jgi:mono/diheme cytochrome c family protein
MRTGLLGVGVFIVAVTSVGANRQGGPAAPAGNAEAGKTHWALGNTSCRNCHGGDGEGAFGPPLAGRKLTYERFRNYVRNPAGRMPAYIDSELTDQEIADLAAYFDTLPAVATPGPWRFELPAGAPRGQQLALSVIGCAQCHGPTLETPRHGAAEVNGGFEWFKRMVYQHTSAQWEQWNQLDPSITPTTPRPAGPPGRNRIRMGNYSPARLPEPLLKEMWDWAMDLGKLVPLSGRITAGPQAPGGPSYTVNVVNSGVKNKGLTAEGIKVEIELPDDANVVRTAGTGYEGVHRSEAGKNVAVWRVPKLAATEQQELTLTLGAPAQTLRGTIRWERPAVKADDEVTFVLAGPGRGGPGGV